MSYIRARISGCTVTILVRLFILLGLSLLCGGRAGADGPAYEMSSTLGDTRMTSVVGPEGIITTQYADASNAAPVRGAIVRYGDRALWGIDFDNRTYVATTLSAQLELRQGMLSQARRSVAGGRESHLAHEAPAALRRSPQTDSIGPFRLFSYALNARGQTWRLWFAVDLPAPPNDVRAGLAQGLPLDVDSRSAVSQIMGRQLVRLEFLVRGVWKPVLSTSGIRRVTMRTADLSPPRGFRRVALEGTPPPGALVGDAGGYELAALAFRGPGPIMPNPELYLVFWGHQLTGAITPAAKGELLGAINAAVDKRYTKYLAQYGVNSAKIIRLYNKDSAPSRDVGNANFASVDAMVYEVGFVDGGPIFWWMVGGHDPLYALFVTSSSVDTSAWAGYHFLAFSLTHVVLPFPVSLFAHDGLPWLIVKVPDNALAITAEGALQRVRCIRHDPSVLPALCTSIDGLDRASHNFSHELVEAATEPYPFFGWNDNSRVPVWTKGELADICSGTPAPWAENSLVQSTEVATFWSNADRGCVPESRPSVTIFEPRAADVLPFDGRPVVLRGWAQDPVDGPIPESLTWLVDGVTVANGATASVAHLPLGDHVLSARVQNSQGASASVTETVTVSSQAAHITIDSPPNGSSFGTDEIIVFRGGALDVQQGTLPSSALTWTINGTRGAEGSQFMTKIGTVGDATVRLTGTNAAGMSGSATVTLHITAPTGRPSVQITQPVSQAAFAARNPDGTLAARSSDIVFSARVTNSAGNVIPATVTWTSDVDGPLGQGSTVVHQLRGGPCGITFHRIMATATNSAGRSAADSIIVSVGQIC